LYAGLVLRMGQKSAGVALFVEGSGAVEKTNFGDVVGGGTRPVCEVDSKTSVGADGLPLTLDLSKVTYGWDTVLEDHHLDITR
jgi:hypothetical protein